MSELDVRGYFMKFILLKTGSIMFVFAFTIKFFLIQPGLEVEVADSSSVILSCSVNVGDLALKNIEAFINTTSTWIGHSVGLRKG